jgi:hypothetical protein
MQSEVELIRDSNTGNPPSGAGEAGPSSSAGEADPSLGLGDSSGGDFF